LLTSLLLLPSRCRLRHARVSLNENEGAAALSALCQAEVLVL
jgi:hypothetical protein